eukprot:GGOE01019070.1.p1 GENE.GGOE01019070.1~~GGOE01019070.1.p1  ORF type:complete len:347 (-),score=42.47 GGOE01019070.1:129-1169(-)
MPLEACQQIPNQLWVGGLPHDYTERDIHDIFGRYGRLTNVDLRTGWAFLTFADTHDAMEAQRALHRQSFDGRTLQVEFRMEKGAQKGGRDLGKGKGKGGGKGGPAYEHNHPPQFPQWSSNLDEHQRHLVDGRPKNWRIEVEGAPRGCGWQELKDWARECGLTPAFAVSVDNGLGVVDFTTKREFIQAMQQLSRRPLSGKDVRIYPARWQPDGAAMSRSASRGRGRKRSRSRSRSRSPRRPPPRGPIRMPLSEMRRLGHDPPMGYVCHQCNEPGHWREHCKHRPPYKRARSHSPAGSNRSLSPRQRRSRSRTPDQKGRPNSVPRLESVAQAPEPHLADGAGQVDVAQ